MAYTLDPTIVCTSVIRKHWTRTNRLLSVHSKLWNIRDLVQWFQIINNLLDTSRRQPFNNVQFGSLWLMKIVEEQIGDTNYIILEETRGKRQDEVVTLEVAKAHFRHTHIHVNFTLPWEDKNVCIFVLFCNGTNAFKHTHAYIYTTILLLHNPLNSSHFSNKGISF